MNEPRPLQHLRDWSARYPRAWEILAGFRAKRGSKLFGTWPNWCYVPIAGAYAAVSERWREDTLSPEHASDIAVISALGAWRMTRGVYRFHPEVLAALWDTPMEREIPIEILYRLPEWSVYIEVDRQIPGIPQIGRLRGFYAQMEWDANTHEHELRFLLDTDEALFAIPVLLSHPTLMASMESLNRETDAYEKGFGAATGQIRMKATDMAAIAAPLVSVVLYLCSSNAEVRDAAGSNRLPANPRPKRVKRGSRIFAAPSPTTWDVAYRLGAAIAAAKRAANADGPAGTHAGPRAHIRRAHWHTYWVGHRGEQRVLLRWVFAIPVNVGGDELPAVVREVD